MARTFAPRQTGSRGRIVPVNGIELYYEDYGAGEPLVLLHGFGGCSNNWLPFTAELSERFRLIVVDLRGHGHSTNPHNDVLLLLEKLGSAGSPPWVSVLAE